MDGRTGSAFSVPRWAIVAGGLLVSIVTGTVSATVVVMKHTQRDETATLARAQDEQITQLRLCRIERALKIEPWPTCPATVQP
jgi:hypothetical protein